MALGFTIVTIIRKFLLNDMEKHADCPTESKWGLGLQNLDDMPIQNIYMFGLVCFVSLHVAIIN
jgi:hypothetical protein